MSNNSSGKPFNYSKHHDMDMAEFVQYIHIIGIPLIVIIGVLGNTVSFLVFVRTHLRYKSSSIYLAFMNVADTGMLISLVPAWLGWLDIDIYLHQGWCQLSIYFPYVFSFLSVWVVVSFTIERYIVVFYPLMRKVFCTLKKALCAMIGLTGSSFMLYSYVLWTTGLRVRDDMVQCTAKEYYKDTLKILSGIDTVITLIIPSVALMILNGSIIWRLFRHHRTHRDLGISQTKYIIDRTRNESVLKRPQLHAHSHHSVIVSYQGSTNSVCSSLSSTNRPLLSQTRAYQGSTNSVCSSFSSKSKPTLPQTKSRKSNTSPSHVIVSYQGSNESVCSSLSSNNKPTLPQPKPRKNKTNLSLVIVSCVFLLLNLPSHAFRVTMFFHQLMDRPTSISSYSLNIIHEICQLFHYINFAANIFLYVSTSPCFREALWMLCRGCLTSFKPKGNMNSNEVLNKACPV